MEPQERGSRPKIRVLVADEHAEARHALCELLRTLSEISVVGEVRRPESVAAHVVEFEPDVVLISFRMATTPGVTAVREIKRLRPATQVVLLGLNGLREAEAFACGADRFLVKGCSGELLLETVLEAAARVPRPEPGGGIARDPERKLAEEENHA